MCTQVIGRFILNLARCHFPELLWTLAPYNDQLSFPHILNSISAELVFFRKFSKSNKERERESERKGKVVVFCTNIDYEELSVECQPSAGEHNEIKINHKLNFPFS